MVHPSNNSDIQYYPTHPLKFTFLSLVTFGLYSLYWCYKCWKYIKVQEKTRIMPFWRAFFAPFWTFALASRILGPTKNWLPLVNQVNRLNAENLPATYHRFRFQHILVSLILAPIFLITTATQFNIIPSTQIVPGYMVYGWQKHFLQKHGGLDRDETILYFYSTAFNMKQEGNYLTDRRVISYWTEEDNENPILLASTFDEISDITIEHSRAYMDPTKVTIHRHDGAKYFLVLSAENHIDREFIGDLQSRWQQAQDGNSI